VSTTIIIDAAHDTWTCDAWTYSGIWTTKNYALTRGIDARGDRDHVPTDSRWVRWIDRSRRGCGAINPCWLLEDKLSTPIRITNCRRCGMYRGVGGYRREGDPR
jgi:hypothetical protein